MPTSSSHWDRCWVFLWLTFKNGISRQCHPGTYEDVKVVPQATWIPSTLQVADQHWQQTQEKGQYCNMAGSVGTLGEAANSLKVWYDVNGAKKKKRVLWTPNKLIYWNTRCLSDVIWLFLKVEWSLSNNQLEPTHSGLAIIYAIIWSLQ